MTVNPGSGQNVDGSSNTTVLNQDGNAGLARAYLETYQGPHGDAPEADSAVTAPVDKSVVGRLVSPAMLAAHARLGKQRRIGETKVAVYGADDAAGFGPALQLVTDQSAMLMDSVTVLLHRLGVAYVAIMNPVFRVRRDPTCELLEMRPAADPHAPRDGIDETWIHVALSPSVDAKTVAEAANLLPNVLADARQVAVDSAALNATLVGLANALDADHAGHFPGYDRRDVAALLRWLADGHFVLLGYQRCGVHDGEASVDPASRLGVLRLRTDVLPQLTGDDDLLVLAQATMPSFLRYGAYPYVVVVRENAGGLGAERQGGGAPVRRAVHRGRDQRQRARDPADLTAGQRSPGVGARRPQSSRAADAGHHPDHSALGALRSQRAQSARHGQGRGRPRLAAAHVAVPAGRPARPLRVVPGVSAPRPLHHRRAARDAGHPGPRAGRRQHRVHREGQRIPLGGSALHRSGCRRVLVRATSTGRWTTRPGFRTF